MAVKMSKTYDDGLAFRFDLPDELSLIAADVIDGVPKLRFVPSLHVPAITEEDVAVCVRLSQEKTRPEFYYSNFPYNHPFYGRHYKDYRPSYLRGTSVGELLAEADWEMKCLNAGVKSDKTKAKFMPWSENSQLDGLATSEHFSVTPSYGVGVYMTCESVEVEKSKEEILFGDPKMAIQVSNSIPYSEYLTKIFDAIAYHDEPLFLRIKELIKLILAMEWFEEKGVRFSAEWVNKHLNRSQMSARQTIAAKSPKLTQEIVNYVLKQFPQTATAPLALPTGEIPAIQMPTPWSIVKIPPIRISTSKTMTDKTFQIKHVRKIDGPGVSNELSLTLTVSIDDYDMLYQGMDPNTPIYNGKFVIPKVTSWSELFAESVPVPCKNLLTSNGEMVNTVRGGVTTHNIPVRQTTTRSKAARQEEVVSASSNRERQKVKRPKAPFVQPVPSKNASCERQQLVQKVLDKGGYKNSYGFTDQTCHRSGQDPAVRYTVRKELSVNGQRQSATLFDEQDIPSSLVENQSTKPSPQHGNSSATEVSRPQRESLTAQQLSPPSEQPTTVSPAVTETVPVAAQDSPVAVEESPVAAEDNPVAVEESLVGSKKSPNGGSPTGSDDESIISDDMAGNSGIMSPTDGLLSPTDKADDGNNFEFPDSASDSETN